MKVTTLGIDLAKSIYFCCSCSPSPLCQGTQTHPFVTAKDGGEKQPGTKTPGFSAVVMGIQISKPADPDCNRRSHKWLGCRRGAGFLRRRSAVAKRARRPRATARRSSRR
jgi:hypothetical protein